MFANQTVLDFYPKFGFHATDEVQYILDYSHHLSNPSEMKKLDALNPVDLTFIYNLAKNRKVISDIFGTSSSEELLMFYCTMVFSQDLYHLENENALVIFQLDGDRLHLYDVISHERINIQTVLSTIVPPEVKKVVFHFHPNEQELPFEKQLYKTNNVLFIKNLTNVPFPNEFKHPLTAKA